MVGRPLVRRACACLLALGVATVAGNARAIKLEADKNIYVDIRYLLQPQFQLSHDGTLDPSITTDFYLRRSRLILDGQVSKYVSFFFDTDQPNWGKGGKWTDVPFIIQDAVATFNIHEAFKVDAGMLIAPFVHQFRQSAGNLNTLDYHTALVKYPDGSNKGWRDMGAELRGLLFDKHFDYRLMVSNGVDSTEDDIPRFSGRLAYNVFDAEEGFFLGGTYLGKKKVLSLGGAFDIQPQAITASEGSRLYAAGGGDIFLDYPIGKNRISGQLDVMYYGAKDNPAEGWGFLFDLGYAFEQVEPLIAVDYYMPDGATTFTDMMFGTHVGLNYWLLGHNANIKADLGFIKDAGRGFEKAAGVLTIQTQVLL